MTPAALLIDVEGTVIDAAGPIPGAIEAIVRLRAAGVPMRFLTNIDARPPAAVLEMLHGHGVAVAPEELFTPVVAARRVLAGPDTRAYALVSASVAPALADLVAPQGPYTHALIGDCADTLDYRRLDEVFRAVHGGAHLLALQKGRYYKRADGNHVDTGAVVAGIEYATGVTAQVLGKPSPHFFGLALDSLGLPVEARADVLVVGDDATTDVRGARDCGFGAVQVRTGKYPEQAAAGLVGQADLTIDSLADLPAVLR
ncbi:HAD hydrolase-like protein [Micromonospora tulbaghiae]|uniref:HAD hydrolase-like protein n=1 Tax=Micromonospora tulbaghiae TaxID=479978 RepID=UPI0036C22DEE